MATIYSGSWLDAQEGEQYQHASPVYRMPLPHAGDWGVGLLGPVYGFVRFAGAGYSGSPATFSPVTTLFDDLSSPGEYTYVCDANVYANKTITEYHGGGVETWVGYWVITADGDLTWEQIHTDPGTPNDPFPDTATGPFTYPSVRSSSTFLENWVRYTDNNGTPYPETEDDYLVEDKLSTEELSGPLTLGSLTGTLAGWIGLSQSVRRATSGGSCFTSESDIGSAIDASVMQWWIDDIDMSADGPGDIIGWPGNVTLHVPHHTRKNFPVLYDSSDPGSGLYNVGTHVTTFEDEITAGKWADRHGKFDLTPESAFDTIGWRPNAPGEFDLEMDTGIEGAGSVVGWLAYHENPVGVPVGKISGGSMTMIRFTSFNPAEWRVTLHRYRSDHDEWFNPIIVIDEIESDVLTVAAMSYAETQLNIPEESEISDYNYLVIGKLETRSDAEGEWEDVTENALTLLNGQPTSTGLLCATKYRIGTRWGFQGNYDMGGTTDPLPETLAEIVYFERQRVVASLTTEPDASILAEAPIICGTSPSGSINLEVLTTRDEWGRETENVIAFSATAGGVDWTPEHYSALSLAGGDLGTVSLDTFEWIRDFAPPSTGCVIKFDNPHPSGKILSTEIVERDMTSGDTGDYFIQAPPGTSITVDAVRSWIT